MKRFLIINPFGIGDVLFTTPALRALKASSADSFVGYWCNERVKAVLEDNPYIDRIFALSRGDIKRIYRGAPFSGMLKSLELFGSIRREHFDISLDFSLDHRYSLISKFAGIKKRVGYNFKGRGRFLTEKIDIDGYRNRHIVDYYLGLLELLALKPQDNKLQLFVNSHKAKGARELFEDSGIRGAGVVIGIAPGAGASWGKDVAIKHWPAQSFAALADGLIRELHAKVVLIGDAQEQDLARIIQQATENKAVNLVGKTSLRELIAVVDNLDMLVTNDGGPLHIAAALGKKTVSFFGPVDPRVYGPYPPDIKKHVVLKSNLECSPCYVKFRLLDCHRQRECLKSIGVEQALLAVKSLL